MDFSPEQDRTRNITGLSLVVGAHLLLGYALVTGLAQRAVNILKQPLEVRLVDAVRPPPPPPPPVLKPVVAPPHAVPPPPVYVPPPEVQPKAPVADTVTAVTTAPPPPVAEVVPAPIAPAPVAKAAPVEAPPPVVVAAPVVALGAACPNHISVRSKVAYPAQAELRGLNGDVLIEFTVAGNGNVGSAHVVKSSDPIFEDAALKAVTEHLHCVGQGQDVRVRIPFSFRHGN